MTCTSNCDDPLVSVVIPVYNVCGYIQHTLDSAACQTYQNTEVIMVDDGSTDGSANICKTMAMKDGRFKYIRKENGGLSSARNYGMKHINGDYLVFLDGDDILASTAIERLLSLAIANDSNLVSCKYEKITSGERFDGIEAAGVHVVDARQHLKMLLLLEDESGSACGKLYGRQLYDFISYPEGQMFEDFGVTARLIARSSRSVVTDAKLYGYMTRPGSITAKRKYGPKHIEGMTASLNAVKDVVLTYPDLQSSLEFFEGACFVRVTSKLSKELCPSGAYFDRLVTQAKVSAKRAAANSDANGIWRARCRLFSISRGLHNVLYGLYGRVTGKVLG